MSSTFAALPTSMTTAAWIEYRATLSPGQRALVSPEFELSYAQLHLLLQRVRHTLSLAGIGPGMKAAVSVGDPILHLGVLLACESLGVASLSFHVQELGLDLGFLDGFDAVVGDGAVERWPGDLLQLRLDAAALAAMRTLDSAALLRDEHPWQPEEIMRVARTSGSTGKPKRLQYPRRVMENWIVGQMSRYGLDQDSVLLITAPMAVNAIYTRLHAVLRLGATLGFGSPWALARKVRITQAWYIPATLQSVLAEAPPDAPTDVVEQVFTSGGGLPRAVRERALARFCRYVHNNYASNEIGLICNHVDEHGIGVLGPGVEVSVRDAQGQDLPLGEVGEFWLRSPAALTGYWEDDPALRERFVAGWYRSGDCGRYVAPRVLQVLGRQDDVLNIDGFKKSLQEVEEIFLSQPGVLEVGLLVVGEAADSRVVAALVIDGQQPPGALLAAIYRRYPLWVRSIEVIAVPRLPRTDNGKLDRAVLRQIVEQVRRRTPG